MFTMYGHGTAAGRLKETLSTGSGFVRINQVFRSHKAVALAALTALATFFSADMLQNAVANGDTRTLSFRHVHSGESATITFKRNGRYDTAALKQLNVLMQDWRRKEPTNMDPQLFDLIWEVYREVGATQPVQVIGGYRSPDTNAMLRSRSRGVAQNSLHTQGKAMDFYIPGVPLAKIREAALRLQRGGVGFYPTSGSPFVHLDTGGVRHWPRMTRPELARVFPDGKTVHVPTDGKPMARYALAQSEIESRGSRHGGAGATFASASGASSGKPAKNIFAALFGKDSEEEADTTAAPAPARAASPAPAEAAPASAPAPVRVASAAEAVPVPQPHPLPRQAVQLAAAPAEVEATVASPAAVALASVPLPVSRPVIPQAQPAPETLVVADAASAAPRPQARPSEAGGLPEIIVRGANGEGPALAYASANADIFPRERLQPGRAPAASAQAAVRPDTRRQTAARSASQPNSAAEGRSREPYTGEMLADIRRLFSSPTVANHAALHTPELRRFASFVAPPRQVVVSDFGRDGSNGLSTSSFSGAAVVAVPVVAMVSGPAPLAQGPL